MMLTFLPLGYMTNIYEFINLSYLHGNTTCNKFWIVTQIVITYITGDDYLTINKSGDKHFWLHFPHFISVVTTKHSMVVNKQAFNPLLCSIAKWSDTL